LSACCQAGRKKILQNTGKSKVKRQKESMLFIAAFKRSQRVFKIKYFCRRLKAV
jgi:hypothetical protein